MLMVRKEPDFITLIISSQKKCIVKKLFTFWVVAVLSLCATSLHAQEPKEAPKAPPAGSSQAEMLELAKASQNPVADMNTVPIQFNWFSGGGLGNQTLSQTLIQPVLPLPLSKDFNIISRTVVPVMSIPAAGGEKLKGIADIQEQIYLSPSRAKGIIWGFGPIFSLPTATISTIATGQFAAGPTGVLLAMPGKFVLGAVINQMWRIAGSSSTTPINQFYSQPFINYNFKLGWSISTAPAITANWSAPSGQQWTVPIGIGVSKITVIGKQALNISFQYYHNTIRPDNAGADQVRMVVAFLFPRGK
jgi:hypothetical protein